MGRRAGVTLVEMLIVVTIIAIMAGVSGPALVAGLSSLRLSTAAGTVASFLTSTMNRVERREEAAAVEVSAERNELAVYTAASGEKPARILTLPPGIRIDTAGAPTEVPPRFMFFPGGTIPRISLVLRNDKGARREVKVDPITAVPDVSRLEPQ